MLPFIPPARGPSPDEIREEMRLSRLLQAYREVFGTAESNRGPSQRLVWEDMEKAGYLRKPTFVRDPDGSLCPLRAAIAEGHRDFFLYVERNVTYVPPATA